LEKAIEQLDIQLNTPHIKASGIANTRAIGFTAPDFLNIIVQYRSSLPPKVILEICKMIERSLGRTDQVEYAPDGSRIYHDRPIDIDILTYGDIRMDTPLLTIPHPQIETRPYIKELLKQL